MLRKQALPLLHLVTPIVPNPVRVSLNVDEEQGLPSPNPIYNKKGGLPSSVMQPRRLGTPRGHPTALKTAVCHSAMTAKSLLIIIAS